MASGQTPLQRVQRCRHVLVLKHRGEQLTEHLQNKTKPHSALVFTENNNFVWLLSILPVVLLFVDPY